MRNLTCLMMYSQIKHYVHKHIIMSELDLFDKQMNINKFFLQLSSSYLNITQELQSILLRDFQFNQYHSVVV